MSSTLMNARQLVALAGEGVEGAGDERRRGVVITGLVATSTRLIRRMRWLGRVLLQ